MNAAPLPSWIRGCEARRATRLSDGAGVSERELNRQHACWEVNLTPFSQITGVERGAEYQVDGVLFDGYDAQRGVLLDAKDWRGYPPANRSFWHEGTLDEAMRQLRAARGKLIEWHFSTPQAKAAVDALFRANRLGGITTIYTPGRG